MAEKPEFPKRDVVPPNGFEVVLVDPKSPPLLVLVPKPENEEKHLYVLKLFTILRMFHVNPILNSGLH